MWTSTACSIIPKRTGKAYWKLLPDSLLCHPFLTKGAWKSQKIDATAENQQSSNTNLMSMSFIGQQYIKIGYARGRMGGRPKADAKKIELALKLYESKTCSIADILRMTGISKSTLYSYVKKK